MTDKPVRADKATAVAELTDQFRSSGATVLTEYRGLTVSQLTQLRRSLGEGSSYAVVKNTLTKRAAEQVGHADLALVEGDAEGLGCLRGVLGHIAGHLLGAQLVPITSLGDGMDVELLAPPGREDHALVLIDRRAD